jgi:hypothetical protein
MKRIYLLPFMLFAGNLFGQTSEPNLYQVAKPFTKIYADNHKDFIVAFDMGKYIDKAGVGSSIIKTDTLFLQPDKSYIGKEFRIENISNRLYITSLTEKKSKKYELNLVESQKTTFFVNSVLHFTQNQPGFIFNFVKNKKHRQPNLKFNSSKNVW